MALIGEIIEGKYEILKLIGKGGMSKVYLAIDKNLNKPWAIKEIDRYGRDKNNEVVVASALAEANMMKRLDHPLLPRIVDILDYPEKIFVVMDYIEGEPLNKVLAKDGPQEQLRVIDWALELCGVLGYLHSQNPPIIYRDMKPANIMLQPNGKIKLIDFGIAREYKEQNMEDTVSLGTKGYAAPEQFGGKGQTDRRTDIYSLGVTLYQLLTGKNPSEPPYEIYPIRYWNPELSAGLESIIIKCTQLNPEDRFDSCEELLFALSHYEEADDSYRAKQKRKVGLFVTLVSLGVISLFTGLFGKLMDYRLAINSHDKYVNSANTAANDKEALDNLDKAIESYGVDVSTYEEMLSLFRNDSEFSTDEETILKSRIDENEQRLSAQKDYGQLAYDIGMLYWYFYSYGSDENSNSLAGHRQGASWFKKAVEVQPEAEYVTQARIYTQIADYEDNINSYRVMGTEEGRYAEYFNNLKALYGSVDSAAEPMIKIEVYRTCLYALSENSKYFKNDGITRDEVIDFYNQLVASINTIETKSERPSELKKEVIANESIILKAIDTAY